MMFNLTDPVASECRMAGSDSVGNEYKESEALLQHLLE
jgi:hypothetical protein